MKLTTIAPTSGRHKIYTSVCGDTLNKRDDDSVYMHENETGDDSSYERDNGSVENNSHRRMMSRLVMKSNETENDEIDQCDAECGVKHGDKVDDRSDDQNGDGSDDENDNGSSDENDDGSNPEREKECYEEIEEDGEKISAEEVDKR